MKHHAFSPRATAALAGMTILLIGGTSTGAMAAVTSASAPSAQQDTPTAPGAPTGLTATPGNNSVTLSWSAPSSDGGAPLTGYVIEGGTSPSDDSVLQNVDGSPATITGLTNGTTYYFRVLAENGTDDTASAVVAVTVPPQGPASVPGSVPGSPAGPTVSSGDDSITLAWSAPASTGGSAITGYHVYLANYASFVGAKEYTTSSRSFSVTDVLDGSTYYLKVTAVNSAGEGPASATVQATPEATAPPRPTGLTARARHGEVTLSWSPPKGGLKSSQGYLVYMGTRSGHEGAKPANLHLIDFVTTDTVAGLRDGTRYYFQVALVDGDQVSARSAEVSAVPGAGSGSGSGSGSGAGSAGGGSSSSTGHSGASGVNPTGAPSGSPLPRTVLTPASSSSSLSAGLIALLVGLGLAVGAGVATVLMRLRRRGYGPRHGSVPAPRDPYDGQPTGPSSRPEHRVEEMDGPRYR